MYCYRFPNKATFDSLCEDAGWLSEGVVITASHDHAIDEIGPVETVPGTYDEGGNELTPPLYDTRHHVNFQGDPPEAWDEWLVVVNSASRIFFGGPSQAPGDEVLEEIV